VFIGACFVGTYFEQLWNINSTTVGQVLIVPSNPTTGVNGNHVFLAWEEILHDMVENGMTAQAAVQETNTYLSKQGDSEQFMTIGDQNVKLH
jgi:hypothetical protein